MRVEVGGTREGERAACMHFGVSPRIIKRMLNISIPTITLSEC